MPQVRWAQVQGAEGKSASRLPHRRVQTQDTNNGHGHGAGRASISDTLGTETGVPELQRSPTRSLFRRPEVWNHGSASLSSPGEVRKTPPLSGYEDTAIEEGPFPFLGGLRQ